MISIPTKRLWIAVAGLLIFGLAGALCGYLQGRRAALRGAESALAADAAGVDGYLSSMVDESLDLLNQLNASPYPVCSHQELEYFRHLIYNARNIRDAGRVRDGRLLCSAIYSQEIPASSVLAKSHYPDGTSVYIDRPPYLIPGVHVFLRQKGNAYVVEDPSFSINFARYRRDHDVLMTHAVNDPHGGQGGFTPKVRGAVFDRNAAGRLGDTLYATRCSARNFTCVVSYGSVAASLHAERGELALKAALGGLCGGFLVLAFLVVYCNGRAMGPQLRRAIRNDRLEMVYQPIVDIVSGRMVGAEALVRWTDEDGLAVSPAIFVKMAEERGFAGELTELVVRHVLRDFGDWMRDDPEFRLNINVTASDLGDPGFLPMLEGALAAAGVAPQQLAIELTESSTVNLQVATKVIRRLRERGHAVQLDDFGTGYSSLAYLKDLAVDAIKIDKAFTQAISTQAVIGTILPQMLQLAEMLDLQATVEGIETAEQAAFFASLDRPVLGQGWFFGRPVPAMELRIKRAAEKKRFDLAQAVGA
ncbi:MAG: EAL domain-containing protein [Terracidiphilus sp.]